MHRLQEHGAAQRQPTQGRYQQRQRQRHARLSPPPPTVSLRQWPVGIKSHDEVQQLLLFLLADPRDEHLSINDLCQSMAMEIRDRDHASEYWLFGIDSFAAEIALH